jgi:REP element-mobilizing transposase RayT
MIYMPGKHHRRSIRLPGYDYSRPGGYFVTICTQEHACIFGRVVDGKMWLSARGWAAKTFWYQIPDHFPHVKLDEHIVMPNHVHGILWITDDVGSVGGIVGAHVWAQQAAPQQAPLQPDNYISHPT